MPSVVANNLMKQYGKKKEIVQALKGISFDVKQGELFGIIGPDGAGKTSLFRVLTTLLLPDGGAATVDGFDVVKDFKEIRRRVGYMPGRFSLYQDLTVAENLEFFATIFNTTIKENYDLIKDIYSQIEPFKDRRAGKLSGGMKQKLALSCALIHRPSVLFLDEPTTGVDAVSGKEFWDMLKRLKEQDISILVSTPYMDEASLCDRIALIQNGNIMSVNTPQNIIESFPSRLFAAKAKDIYKLLKDFRGDPTVNNCYAFGEYLHMSLNDDTNSEIVLQDLEGKYQPQDFEVKRIIPTIEDCFIQRMRETEKVSRSNGKNDLR